MVTWNGISMVAIMMGNRMLLPIHLIFETAYAAKGAENKIPATQEMLMTMVFIV